MRDRCRIPAAELVGKTAVDGAEGGEECGFVARGGGDGEAEGAGGTDGFLDEVGEGPAAADVGYVCGGGGGDGGYVVDEVGDRDVGVCCAWREGEQDCEEGVLEEDGLPEFATLLLLESCGVGTDDVGVAMQAHGVGLAD